MDGGRLPAFRSPPPPFGPPLINLYCTKRWQVAAALSAAVTTTKQQETAPCLQGQIVWRKNQLKPQLLFGRGLGEALLLEKRPPPAFSLPRLFGREREEGEDSHSRQWRLSMAVF